MKKMTRRSIQWFFLVVLWVCVSVDAELPHDISVQKESVSEITSQVLEEKLYAVHATRIIPQDGVVKATCGVPETLPDKLQSLFPDMRSTVHFALGELVRPVGDWMSWEDCPYAVVTPLESLVPQLININCYDTFILGDFNFDSTSILVLPIDTNDPLPTNINLYFYNPTKMNLREAVDHVIQLNDGWSIRMTDDIDEDELKPAFLDGQDINRPAFFAPLLEERPYLSVGLRFDPLDGENHRLSSMEGSLLELASCYLAHEGWGNSYPIPTEDLREIQQCVEEDFQVFSEHIATMTMPDESRHAYALLEEVIANWINIINADIQVRESHGKTLIGCPQKILEAVALYQSLPQELYLYLDSHWESLPEYCDK